MTKDYAKNRSKLTQKRHNRYKGNMHTSTGLPSWAWMLLGLMFGIALSSFIFWKGNSKNKTTLLNDQKMQQTLAINEALESKAKLNPKSKALKKIKTIQTPAFIEEHKEQRNIHTNDLKDLRDLRDLSAHKKQSTPESRFDFYTLLPTIQVDTAHPESAQINKKNTIPYILQAGSFKTQEQADQLKAILALQGLEAHIQTVTINAAESWYRVYIGPFPTKAEALNIQQNLENGSAQGPNQNLNSVILKMRV